jgi:hypothetical protein
LSPFVCHAFNRNARKETPREEGSRAKEFSCGVFSVSLPISAVLYNRCVSRFVTGQQP